MRYHVVVAGSRPEKDGKKFLPLPTENIEFITKTLNLLPADSYVALYHGASGNGVDALVDEYARERKIKVHQYPAYWFNPSKPDNFDKAAGFFRIERMVRDAKQNVWEKPEESVVVLAFHNKPLAESAMTNHVVDVAKKIGLTYRTYELPVQTSTTATTAPPQSEGVPF